VGLLSEDLENIHFQGLRMQQIGLGFMSKQPESSLNSKPQPVYKIPERVKYFVWSDIYVSNTSFWDVDCIIATQQTLRTD
jgi:hypothetical protein